MTNRIKLSPVEGNKACYQVIEPFLFIEKGFVFDGASVPSCLKCMVVCPFDPRYIEDFAIHDYCYRTGYMSRENADTLLRDRLLSHGMSKAQANLIYYPVRMFGGKHYHNQED